MSVRRAGGGGIFALQRRVLSASTVFFSDGCSDSGEPSNGTSWYIRTFFREPFPLQVHNSQ